MGVIADRIENPLAALRTIWLERRDDVLQRAARIDDAVAAAEAGDLGDELRADAIRQAHMLAGSAGTFGFVEASEHARRLEAALPGASSKDLGELRSLVDALHRELRREDVLAATEDDDAAAAIEHLDLLVIGGRSDRTQHLADQATQRGLSTHAALSIDDAVTELESNDPALVLLDLEVPEGTAAALRFLEEAAERRPVLVIVDAEHVIDRLEVAQRGGRGFLPRTLDVEQMVDETLGLRDRLRRRGTRVLVVDDDPSVLDFVAGVLDRAGLEVHVNDARDDPWQALERVEPDLVVLDIELPGGTSGIDLCRRMRADLRWAPIPALVLSARTDRDTITEVFAAGADDYVPKPFVGPELLARITNRLERVRLLHELAERDHLTGLNARRRGAELLEDLRTLARRTGGSFVVAVLDCDDFKRVNDTYGHAMGDMVLQTLANALQRTFGAEDVVARWGGDEFVVGMYGMRVEDARERLGQLLEEIAGRRFVFYGHDTQVRLSAGLAVYPKDGDTLEELLRAADEGLYAAKAEGGGRVTLADTARAESVNVDVVVVEDDPAVVALLAQALNARGYTFRHLADGLDAAAAIAAARPEVVARVILLDCDLPGIDGMQLLRTMAENGTLARSRVIMLTSRSKEADVLAALEAGAIDHVAKPFSVPVLMQRVRKAMQR